MEWLDAQEAPLLIRCRGFRFAAFDAASSRGNSAGSNLAGWLGPSTGKLCLAGAVRSGEVVRVLGQASSVGYLTQLFLDWLSTMVRDSWL